MWTHYPSQSFASEIAAPTICAMESAQSTIASPPQMWTAADLARAGLDLRQLCVEYAAVGECPRGRACCWVHCRLDTGCE